MEQLFTHGLADSTQRSYASAKRRYLQFCSLHNVSPLPTSEHLLCQYVAFLSLSGLVHSTIKCYLAAVRHLHIEQHRGDPGISSMPRLELVVKGVKREQAMRIEKSRGRQPISIDILKELYQVWRDKASAEAEMLWAAASLCFFGFFRSGELTVPSVTSYDAASHLSRSDVSVDSLSDPQTLRIHLKMSKTDPFRTGVDVFVGRTHCPLCPIAAVLAYLTKRGPQPGPLFRFCNGQPLTRGRFVAEVKEALALAGIDNSQYSGHSFRSGAATTAVSRGLGDATIQMLGRWKSDAYRAYIKTPQVQLAKVSRKLAGGT